MNLVLTLPVLERIKNVERVDWFSEVEADVLIATATRALTETPGPHSVVEVGSYCGRSTIVLASVVKIIDPSSKIYAIDDMHMGSLEKFQVNVAQSGVSDVIELIQQRSFEVVWNKPISMLFIDGNHGYTDVSGDFGHFEEHIVPGGYVAFHDYHEMWPGIIQFVDEIVDTGKYTRIGGAGSVMVVRKL